MRKAAIILIAFLCTVALLNRNAFKDDISNRTVVQGIGIDINDDETYTVTLETINTENYSNSDGSAKPVMNLRIVDGKTVSSAIKSAFSFDGKTPVLSQNRVIIIGKDLAEKGIIEALDFFIRDAENYPTVQVAAVEEKAADFFKNASDESSVVSRNIEKILLTSDEDIAVTSITLCELANRAESKGQAFYMPIVSTFKEKDKPEVKSNGTAVFRNGKYVCNLDDEETIALNFLCNDARKGAIDFYTDNGPAAISVIKSSTARSVDYSSDTPNFNVKIKIEADIAEASGGGGYNLSESEVSTLNRNAEEKIENSVKSLCQKLYSVEKADAPGLSRLIYIYYPEKFRAAEKNLSEIMTESHYTVEVEMCIRRIGQDYSS